MNCKRGLMTVLVGLAMLATPIVAAAKDFKHGGRNGQFVGPAFVTRNDFRSGAVRTPPPAAFARHDWRHGWNDHDADDYRGYGNRGYYAPVYTAPVYAAPVYPGYGGGYGGGAGCGQAQRVLRTYSRDRATGHPAAAADLLRQNQWSLRSGCGGAVGRGRGLGGFGGYGGVPAYTNYGGYNGRYGQPYGNGSTLAPLFQYFH